MAKESNRPENEERKPFRIQIKEHETFQDIMKAKYLTTTEFCKIVSNLFKPVFSDFEGCIFESNQQGYGYVAMFFNHNEVEDPDRVKAISRTLPEDNNIKNDVVRRVRYNDSRNRNGDKYFLTEEAKDAFEPFIDLRMVSHNRQNNKIDWSKLTAEVTQPPAQFGQYPVNYTKLSMIDPRLLATFIFGDIDEKGDRWEYDVRVLRSVPQLVQGPNFQGGNMLAIEAVRESEVQRLCNMMGIVPNAGLNIIR